MKNLSHVGSKCYSSTNNNMADDGEDLFLHYWNGAYLTPETVSQSVPVVGAGNPVVDEDVWKNGVVEGMEKNGAVGGMEKNWAELMPMVGAAAEFASGRSDEDHGMSALRLVGVDPPPQGTVNKRAADLMGGAPPAARGSKRQRSASGSIETATGGSNGGGGSDVSGGGKGKRLWARDRDGNWWDTVSSPGYPDADFKRDFHMSRSTFAALCEMVAPAGAKEDTKMRTAIPVPKRVAVCVWRLSMGEPFLRISKRFGIGLSTCRKLVLEVSAAIRTIVLPQVVLWPDSTTAPSVAAKFQALSGGIPDVIGAVYTTHIPIIAPKFDVIKYYNEGLTGRNGKTSYSVRMHASVDADGAFTDACAGSPGAVPDEDVLLRSWLERRTGDMLAQEKRLVGGAGYPLMDWMLVPYSLQNLTSTQHEFNEKVAAARAVAVDAFQRLKTRWAYLQKRSEIKVDDLPAIFSACCALHNWCERSGDELDPELPRFELVDDDVVDPN